MFGFLASLLFLGVTSQRFHDFPIPDCAHNTSKTVASAASLENTTDYAVRFSVFGCEVTDELHEGVYLIVHDNDFLTYGGWFEKLQLDATKTGLWRLTQLPPYNKGYFALQNIWLGEGTQGSKHYNKAIEQRGSKLQLGNGQPLALEYVNAPDHPGLLYIRHAHGASFFATEGESKQVKLLHTKTPTLFKFIRMDVEQVSPGVKPIRPFVHGDDSSSEDILVKFVADATSFDIDSQALSINQRSGKAQAPVNVEINDTITYSSLGPQYQMDSNLRTGRLQADTDNVVLDLDSADLSENVTKLNKNYQIKYGEATVDMDMTLEVQDFFNGTVPEGTYLITNVDLPEHPQFLGYKGWFHRFTYLTLRDHTPAIWNVIQGSEFSSNEIVLQNLFLGKQGKGAQHYERYVAAGGWKGAYLRDNEPVTFVVLPGKGTGEFYLQTTEETPRFLYSHPWFGIQLSTSDASCWKFIAFNPNEDAMMVRHRKDVRVSGEFSDVLMTNITIPATRLGYGAAAVKESTMATLGDGTVGEFDFNLTFDVMQKYGQLPGRGKYFIYSMNPTADYQSFLSTSWWSQTLELSFKRASVWSLAPSADPTIYTIEKSILGNSSVNATSVKTIKPTWFSSLHIVKESEPQQLKLIQLPYRPSEFFLQTVEATPRYLSATGNFHVKLEEHKPTAFKLAQVFDN